MAENTIERIIKVDTAGSEKTVRDLVAEAENARKKLSELQEGADGYAAAAKRAAEAEQQLNDAMAISQTSVQSERKSIAELSEMVEGLTGARGDLIRQMVKEQDMLKDVASARKELNKAIKENRISEEAAAKQKEQLLSIETQYKASLAQTQSALKSVEKQVQAAAGSYDQMSQTLGRLRAAYRQLGEEQRNASQGKELLKQIQNLDSELKKLDASMGQYQRNVGNYAGGVQKAFAKIAAAWMAVKAIYSFFSSSIDTIKEFEQANANLATIVGASKSEMDALRESALGLGRTTEYTASQVTLLQTELAKLGFGPQSIQAMQEPILHFATAVGAQLPEAAKLAGATLRIFGLDANQTEDTLDVLTTATNKSALSFSYLENAMSTVGPVANTFGLSVRDTTALLAALANSGFEASTAATATRNILLNLADANGALAQALGGPIKTIPELVDGLKKLDAEGIDLAGTLALTDKRSVAAFNTFLHGADSVKELREAFEDVGGTAKRISEERLNTVEGSIKLMESAWEGLVLSFYNSKGVIKSVIDGITRLITGVTKLVGPSEALVDQFDKQADYIVRLVDDIQPLAEEYDKLKGKTSLNADEQERLNILTQQLGDAYPPAIAAIDEYGNAIDLNTGKIYENIEAEKARLKILNKGAIEELEKNIAKQDAIIQKAQEAIEAGGELVTTVGGMAGTATSYTREFTEAEIQALRDETQEASEVRLGYMAELKKRNGQELEEAIEAARQRRAALLSEQKKTADELSKQRAKTLSEKELKAQQKAAEASAKATEKAMRDTLKMEQQAREKTLENELQTAKENYQQDLADFNKTVKEKNTSEEAAAAYRTALAEKYEADIVKIRQKYAEKQAKEEKKKRDEEKKYAMDFFKEESADLERQAKRETAEAKRDIKDPQELEQELNDIQQRLYEARIALIDEMVNSGELGADAITELSNQRADLEIKNIERVAERERKAAEEKKKRDKLTQETALNVATSTLNSLSSILGEETAAGKAAAVASAIIDTYKAANSAYASLASVPIVGPGLGAAAAAAAVVAGIANVKKIIATKEDGSNAASVAATPNITTPAVVTPPAVIEQVPLTRTLTSASEEERLNQMASTQRVIVVYDDIAEAARTVEVQQTESTF